MSGCGQGHELAKKHMKEAVAEFSRANDVKIQIKEGVTSLEDLYNSV